MPMFGWFAPRQRPGRAINSRAIDRPAQEIARQARARPGGTIAAIEAAGSTEQFEIHRSRWLIRITAVGTSTQSGQYSWQAIYPIASSPGTYADLVGWSGSLGGDALYEDNATPNLAIGDRLEVTRDYYSGRVRAQYSHC